MHRYVVSLSLAAAALAAPLLASAQLTGSLTIATDYRFRGLSQTMSDGPFDVNDGGPALQGGIDYAHSSGFYIGNWNSNVSSAIFPNANLEMDFYGGYKKAFGDFGLDVGAIYYFYPGSSATLTNLQTGESCTDCRIDNTEIYVGGSWKFLSAKFFYALDDFFAIPGTEGSWYLDLNATFEVLKGLSLVGHFGRQEVNDFSDANYNDWKLGVTYDLAGWLLGLAYVDTDAKSSAYTFSDARKTMNIGDATVVLSVTKTF